MGNIFGLVIALIYLGGGWKFWSGFRRTNFTQNRLMLTLLWPVMLVNKSYRQNFMRALKS